MARTACRAGRLPAAFPAVRDRRRGVHSSGARPADPMGSPRPARRLRRRRNRPRRDHRRTAGGDLARRPRRPFRRIRSIPSPRGREPDTAPGGARPAAGVGRRRCRCAVGFGGRRPRSTAPAPARRHDAGSRAAAPPGTVSGSRPRATGTYRMRTATAGGVDAARSPGCRRWVAPRAFSPAARRRAGRGEPMDRGTGRRNCGPRAAGPVPRERGGSRPASDAVLRHVVFAAGPSSTSSFARPGGPADGSSRGERRGRHPAGPRRTLRAGSRRSVGGAGPGTVPSVRGESDRRFGAGAAGAPVAARQRAPAAEVASPRSGCTGPAAPGADTEGCRGGDGSGPDPEKLRLSHAPSHRPSHQTPNRTGRPTCLCRRPGLCGTRVRCRLVVQPVPPVVRCGRRPLPLLAHAPIVDRLGDGKRSIRK